jgi:hypothetical protein
MLKVLSAGNFHIVILSLVVKWKLHLSVFPFKMWILIFTVTSQGGTVIIRDHAWRQKSPAVLVTFKGVIL